jgi:hypothetical protein
VRERERKKERERELTELERKEMHTKRTLLEILWCDDYWIPYTGYGTVEQREKPPRNESFTQRE